MSVPAHGLRVLSPQGAGTWHCLLQEQQQWHILTATGPKAALMGTGENLFPSCESGKDNPGGENSKSFGIGCDLDQQGTQREGLRDNITEQPRFELPLRKNLPSPHSPEQNMQGKKKWGEILIKPSPV